MAAEFFFFNIMIHISPVCVRENNEQQSKDAPVSVLLWPKDKLMCSVSSKKLAGSNQGPWLRSQIWHGSGRCNIFNAGLWAGSNLLLGWNKAKKTFFWAMFDSMSLQGGFFQETSSPGLLGRGASIEDESVSLLPDVLAA
jgi:hypothetical protein